MSWERLATVSERQGDRPATLAAWRRALAVSEPLAAPFPDKGDLRATPVVHLAGIARGVGGAGADGRAEARRCLQRALDLLIPLAAGGKLDTVRAGWIALIRAELATLDE